MAADLDVSDLSCTECHNDTTLIWSKEAQFRERSVHGTGEAFERGGSTNCAGCHGHEGAKARISAGLPPHDPSVEGVTNVSPYDCRTCHQIHTTYTGADFALTGDAQPVVLEMTGGTFDSGAGNLCSNCHQIRNELPVATGGVVEFETTRFGTHHGVEAPMLLGEGGLLGVTGSPSPHYTATEDGCVTCHMGEERNHTYEPELVNCQGCHADLDTFDRNGVQTEIQGLLDEVKALLISSGIMSADYEEDGVLEQNRSIAGAYPEEVAGAMWNYMFVLEDQSHGVHNPGFARALLEAARDALQG
ncbi:MAG: hypothetical protein OEM97_00450 [Acidimicrobiia bacterium]|nr:hypothetical protein [Acidimicrobiia bacterium]